MSKKSLKTPLRYPGGKSRACTKMGQFFPAFSNYKEFREPFLGGGSVAIYLSKMHPSLNIWVNDLYEPLVNFWQTIQDDGQNLQDMIWSLKNKYPDRDTARELFVADKFITILNRTKNPYKGSIARKNNEILKDSA